MQKRASICTNMWVADLGRVYSPFVGSFFYLSGLSLELCQAWHNNCSTEHVTSFSLQKCCFVVDLILFMALCFFLSFLKFDKIKFGFRWDNSHSPWQPIISLFLSPVNWQALTVKNKFFKIINYTVQTLFSPLFFHLLSIVPCNLINALEERIIMSNTWWHCQRITKVTKKYGQVSHWHQPLVFFSACKHFMNSLTFIYLSG